MRTVVTKEDVLAVVGKEYEISFDSYMAMFEPIIIGNKIHYPDDKVKKFLEINHKVYK
jgi:hypothetical protein